MNLWSFLFAGLVVAVPAGVVTAEVDTLENNASPTQQAERMRNATPVAEPPAPSVSPESLAILALVNNERTARGLAPMQVNVSLNAAAQGHSAAQAAAGTIYHVSPEWLGPGGSHRPNRLSVQHLGRERRRRVPHRADGDERVDDESRSLSEHPEPGVHRTRCRLRPARR